MSKQREVQEVAWGHSSQSARATVEACVRVEVFNSGLPRNLGP
jgi:hypothetical protein